ncbi:MAG: serine/threonine protein phosphatase [Catenulispora sp.]|nr:serine/threonine protein phosphatase [Catenulispora sp.]
MTGQPLYAMADIHGHRAEMNQVLRDEGLVNARGDWSGGTARLWFLGDYVDRGPDGIGVLEDVRRLTTQATAAGGEVGTLLGNHELQLLAARTFGARPVAGLDWPDGWYGGWMTFGGNEDDLRRLTDEHASWIRALPGVALVDDFLLLHSDTLDYLEFGRTISTINVELAQALRAEDPEFWLQTCGRLSSRGAFRDADPARAGDAPDRMLQTLGGTVIVHGHTQLSQFGVEPASVTHPLRYAAGRVLDIDGGVFEGGRVLLARLA